jgi:two-component system, NtrC family, response regulator GlrR
VDNIRCALISIGLCPIASTKVLEVASQISGLTVFDSTSESCEGLNFSAFIVVISAVALTQSVDAIERLRRQAPTAPVLAVTEGANAEILEALLSAGVTDFISMPIDTIQLVARLRRALGLTPQARPPAPQSDAKPSIRGLIYTSQALARTATRLHTMARCDANVLVVGETGTGKEVCAQAVHYLSARASNPWVPVNCGAIPGDLVETELFGHVKGAYTTALAARNGLVREAERGTLFLDDVDCLSLSAQSKLLRFLQEGEYRPVGSNQLLHANVRVIAASNCDLQLLAQKGAFRLDLYFRLSVLRLHLPALRERPEDIPVLALHFIRHFGREFHSTISGLTPHALKALCAHSWPGNVRELKHVMERAMLMSRGPILGEADIEIDGVNRAQPSEVDESFRSAKQRAVSSFERAYLERMLVAHSGNIAHAADASKKDRRSFFELMRKYDLKPLNFRSEIPR